MTMFSILVANYNNGSYFPECYESIMAQTWQDWEVVIVDDGSTDDSVNIIKQLVADDPRFRYYENEHNHGCGYTKHRCVSLANGALCGFLDPDDVIEPMALERMVAAHQQGDHVLVYSNCMLCDDQLKPYNVYTRARQVDTADPRFFNLDYAVLAFCSFKREAYAATAGIDPYMQRAVDQDLYLKLAEQGAFLFITDVLYRYRMHRTGISVSNEDRAQYWHWVAIITAAKRRNIAVDDLFISRYVRRQEFEQLKKSVANSRVLKIKKILFGR